MAKTRVQFPVGGLSRKHGFQGQPPYTTPDCRNVRPALATPGRIEGGTRPGLLRHTYGAMPSGYVGSPVNMLGNVEYNEDTLVQYLDEDFEGFDNDEDWFTTPDISWLRAISIDPENKLAYADYSAGNPFGLVRASQDQDTAQDLTFQMLVCPYRGSHRGIYRFYLHLDDSAPNPTVTGTTVTVTLTTSGGADSITVAVAQVLASATVVTSSTGPTSMGYHDARLLKVEYTAGTRRLRVQYGPQLDTTPTPDEAEFLVHDTTLNVDAGLATHRRYGFSMMPASGSTGNEKTQIDWFRAWWQMPAGTTTPTKQNRIMSAAGGKILAEGIGGNFSDVSNGFTVRSDVPLLSSPRIQKFYIADYGPWVSTIGEGDGQCQFILAGGKIRLYRLDAGSFVTDGVTTSMMAEVTSITATAATNLANFGVGVYSISAVAASYVELSRNTAYATTTTPCTFRIRRGPKVYDPATNLVTMVDNSFNADLTPDGAIPLGCPFVCEYRDRMFWGGDPGYAWYASALGDPLDYAYGASVSNPRRAIYGAESEAGNCPEIITAMFAFTEDFILFGCSDAVFKLRGDPAYGGQFLATSRKLGIVSGAAWTLDDKSVLRFMSRRGLAIANADGSSAELLSPKAIPNELSNLDPNEAWVSVCYDAIQNGIHIFITGRERRKRFYHWWYDLEHGGYWPLTLNDSHEPLFAVQSFGYLARQRNVLIAGRDGILRYFSRRARTDDSQSIVSTLVYGPFRGGASDVEAARLDEIRANMPGHSEAAVLHLYAADTPEEATLAAQAGGTSKFNHTLARYNNRGMHPRVRGGAFCIRVVDSSNSRWSVNSIETEGRPAGLLRA